MDRPFFFALLLCSCHETHAFGRACSSEDGNGDDSFSTLQRSSQVTESAHGMASPASILSMEAHQLANKSSTSPTHAEKVAPITFTQPVPPFIAQFGQLVAMSTGFGVIFLLALSCLSCHSYLPAPVPAQRSAVQELKHSWSMYLVALSLMTMQLMTTNQYLPSMSIMKDTFDTTSQMMSLTLQINWFIKALSSLVVAGLADRFGRRPLLMLCSILAVSGSLTCACARSVGWFMAGRVFQGMAEGAEPIVAMIARDMIEDVKERQAWMGSFLAVCMFAPTVAPSLGGMIGQWIGWRVPFLMLSFWALCNIILVHVYIKETLIETRDRQPYRTEVKRVVGDIQLVVLSLVQAGVFFVIYSVDSSLSLILGSVFHQTQLEISAKLAGLAACMIPGCIVLEAISGSVQAINVLRGAMGGLLVLVLSFILISIFVAHSWQPFLAIACLLFACVMPIWIVAQTLYFQPVKDISGAAAGINTFVTVVVTSIGAFASRTFVHNSNNEMHGLSNWMAMVLLAMNMIFWPGFGCKPPIWSFAKAGETSAEQEGANKSNPSPSIVS